MKLSNIIFSVLVMLLFSACASMYVPGSEEINKLQIVKMGSKKPEGNEYLLNVPAGAKIPVHFSVKGNLISAPIDNNQVTKLNRELYIYKYWASLDGKEWKPTGEILKMPIAIGVDPEGGQVTIRVDTKKN